MCLNVKARAHVTGYRAGRISETTYLIVLLLITVDRLPQVGVLVGEGFTAICFRMGFRIVVDYFLIKQNITAMFLKIQITW